MRAMYLTLWNERDSSQSKEQLNVSKGGKIRLKNGGILFTVSFRYKVIDWSRLLHLLMGREESVGVIPVGGPACDVVQPGAGPYLLGRKMIEINVEDLKQKNHSVIDIFAS